MEKSSAYWEGYSAGLEKVGVSLKWVQKMLGPKNIARFKNPTGEVNNKWLDALEDMWKVERKYPRIAETLLYGRTPVTPALEYRKFMQQADELKRIGKGFNQWGGFF